MYIITGSTGHLGRLVIESLLQRVPAQEIVAVARSVEKVADLAARGVQVRHGDYDKPETLASAFEGGGKVLLVSSSELGKRVQQHRNAIDAAKRAGASLLVYTSVLNADSADHGVVPEHRATEQMIRDSGLPFVFLRNGWYFENYTERLASVLEHGALVGSADEGRLAAASRSDYAAAAAAVLTGSGHEAKVYELGGDEPFTITELASEISRATGKTIVYKDLPPEQYRQVLIGAGLPAVYADLYVSADLAITRGELTTSSGDLHHLIGRGTTSMHDAVRSALA